MITASLAPRHPSRTRLLLSVLVLVMSICFSRPLAAQSQQHPLDWKGFGFLMGEWVGEGGGTPGEAVGGFSFATDLDSTILVRKNFADYPATKDRPAFSHHDLMIVYQEAGEFKADYFDNEHHVIHYTVTPSVDGSTVVFLSEAAPSAPRFRMTYIQKGTDALHLTFEIAPPGQPEAFRSYIEATAKRKSP